MAARTFEVSSGVAAKVNSNFVHGHYFVPSPSKYINHIYIYRYIFIEEVTQVDKLADSAYGIYIGYQRQPGRPWEERHDPRDPPAINPRSWPSDRFRRWNVGNL